MREKRKNSERESDEKKRRIVRERENILIKVELKYYYIYKIWAIVDYHT